MPDYPDLTITSETWQAIPGAPEDLRWDIKQGEVLLSSKAAPSADSGMRYSAGQSLFVPTGTIVWVRRSGAWDAVIVRDCINPVAGFVTSMQKKYRQSFSGASLDAAEWETVQVGSGQTVTVSGGNLNIAAGTTANAETILMSRETFQPPFRLSFHALLSQRIANQDFVVEFVSVDPITGLPDGKHGASWILNGTSATTGIYSTWNGGLAPLNSAGVTIPTTASPGVVLEIEASVDECWWHAGALDSANGRTNGYRRHQQVLDPNALYKIRVRAKNGASAPASATTFSTQFIAVLDYAELQAELVGGRGQTAAGQGLGVNVIGTVPVSGTVTATNTPASPSLSAVNSAATTNATSVKATAGSVWSISASNTSASPRYLKLYNKASAPTVGTDIPILTIPLAAGSASVLEFGALGLRFTTGIAFAITGAAADTDTTAIAAGEVKVCTSYT